MPIHHDQSFKIKVFYSAVSLISAFSLCFQIRGAIFPSFMEFQLDSAEYCQAQHK